HRDENHRHPDGFERLVRVKDQTASERNAQALCRPILQLDDLSEVLPAVFFLVNADNVRHEFERLEQLIARSSRFTAPAQQTQLDGPGRNPQQHRAFRTSLHNSSLDSTLLENVPAPLDVASRQKN